MAQSACGICSAVQAMAYMVLAPALAPSMFTLA